MADTDYSTQDYTQPRVPPSTPPAIDANTDAHEAAIAPVNGDSDEPGSARAQLDRAGEDRELQPGNTPDEVAPDQGDTDHPGNAPDETNPDQGDTDHPGNAPDETNPDQGDFDRPDSAPNETPPLPETQPGGLIADLPAATD